MENTYQPKDEVALGSRVLNFEKMVGDLTKNILEMKNKPPQVVDYAMVAASGLSATAHRAVGGAAHVAARGAAGQGGNLGAVGRTRTLSLGQQNGRGRSPSVKRKPDGQDIVDESLIVEEPFTEVKGKTDGRSRKPRPVQYGTSAVNVVGGEAAPYEVFIGNTNPSSTEVIIKQVLQECAQTLTG